MQNHIVMDFETKSLIDIRKAGAARYAEDPSTEILCLAYSINKGGPRLWLPGDEAPEDLLDAILDGAVVHAHNAFFERMIWENICVKRMGWPGVKPRQWRCTAAKAAACGLPRNLAGAGKALRLSVVKDEAGGRIMKKVSKPRKPTKKDPSIWHTNPQDLHTTYEYCKTDVLSEEALDGAVRDLTPREQEVWFVDQVINHRGVTIDTRAVNAALGILKQYADRENARLMKITSGELANVSKRDQMIAYLRRLGVNMPNLQAATVEQWLELPDVENTKLSQLYPGVFDEGLNPLARQVLEIRQSLNKSSVAKFEAMLRAVCQDGRIHDMLMYCGAHTGRWTARIVQTQNLIKGKLKTKDGQKVTMDEAIADIMRGELEFLEEKYGDPMKVLTGAVRGMLTAGKGKRLLAADYNAIEARVLLWLAGDEKGIELFMDESKCIYCDLATDIYKFQVIKSKHPDERQMGKQGILGLGFGMGAPKFVDTCAKYKMPVTLEFAKDVVKIYRKKYDKVADYDEGFWATTERSAIQAVRTGKPVKNGLTTWFMHKQFLYCRLPSGRCLAYCEPHLAWVETPWGAEKEELRYMGMGQTKGGAKKWGRLKTYGGRLVENIVQGTARDLMADALVRLENAGYDVLMHSHDEIVSEAEIGYSSLEEYCQIMAEVPAWAQGCPIKVEGWEGHRYRKD